jgi:hypothetical protein
LILDRRGNQPDFAGLLVLSVTSEGEKCPLQFIVAIDFFSRFAARRYRIIIKIQGPVGFAKNQHYLISTAPFLVEPAKTSLQVRLPVSI